MIPIIRIANWLGYNYADLNEKVKEHGIQRIKHKSEYHPKGCYHIQKKDLHSLLKSIGYVKVTKGKKELYVSKGKIKDLGAL